MRFVQQVNASINGNSKPDNYLKPKNLTNIEQTTIKEIFKHVEKFQGKMKFDYIGAWSRKKVSISADTKNCVTKFAMKSSPIKL